MSSRADAGAAVSTRRLAYGIAATRVGVSALFAAAPAYLMGAVFGANYRRPAVRLAARQFMLRDLALGAGLARALRAGRGAGARAWMLAGVAADAADMAGIAACQPRPRRRALLLAAVAPALCAQAALAARLGSPRPRKAQTHC